MCLVGVWKVSNRFRKVTELWLLSERCLDCVWKVSGGSKQGVLKVYGSCLEGVGKEHMSGSV